MVKVRIEAKRPEGTGVVEERADKVVTMGGIGATASCIWNPRDLRHKVWSLVTSEASLCVNATMLLQGE